MPSLYSRFRKNSVKKGSVKELNFDKRINRRGTGAVKWDILTEDEIENGLIPMWVADMDFAIPEGAVEACKKRLEHPIFGYTLTPDSYYDALINWYKKRFSFEFTKEDVLLTPGVVPGINTMIQALTKPKDDIMITTPVYHQFQGSIERTGREILDVPLVRENGEYFMDFEAMEKAITPKTSMFILCHPHNPVGKIWSKEELQQLGDFCKKHELYLVSDEIHADLKYSDKEYTVIYNVDDSFKDFTILLQAPNKTFNIAGEKTGNAIILSEEIREKVQEYLAIFGGTGFTIFGTILQQACYETGEDWLEELLVYLEGNIDYLIDFFEEHIPEIKVEKPEATYLLWADCSGLGLKGDELMAFFKEKAKILPNAGETFGEGYEDHVRLNIATTRENIEKACDQLKKAVEEIR